MRECHPDKDPGRAIREGLGGEMLRMKSSARTTYHSVWNVLVVTILSQLKCM